SFELVSIAAAIARQGQVDAIVAIGCVITGETPHDQYICSAVANGLAQISVETGIPVAFGVLTCQTMGQARNRAGGRQGNKGEEAMTAAIEAAGAVRQVRELTDGRSAERSSA
ncbi:MAG: 6,7-dimethyl-8-ribityllumazine synthase, partial [Phycisphaerales bacterium]